MTTETTGSKRADHSKISYGGAIKTALILVAISFLVGVVLDVLNLEPLEFWRGLVERVGAIFEAIFSIGWGTISRILRYIVFGAAIVVPVWLVIFLINLRKR